MSQLRSVTCSMIRTVPSEPLWPMPMTRHRSELVGDRNAVEAGHFWIGANLGIPIVFPVMLISAAGSPRVH